MVPKQLLLQFCTLSVRGIVDVFAF